MAQKLVLRKIFGVKFGGSQDIFWLCWRPKDVCIMEGKVSRQTQKCQQEAHKRLMKMCGGTGKDFNIPPKEFIPHSLLVGMGKCGKCDDTFESKSDVKSHILEEHKADVKKAYANEAWEMVAVDEKYVEWLKKISLSKETNESASQEVLFAHKFLKSRGH